MGQKLYKEYELLLSRGDWKYYPIQEMLSMDLFFNRDAIINFFKSYLGKGEKANLHIIKFIDSLTTSRLQHTFSCFLLGILICEKCESLLYRINNELNKISIQNPEKPKERFKYLWMLISIFHDFGYAIENKDEELSKNEFEKLITKLHSHPKTIPDIYTKKLLRNYAKYHLCRFGSNDHGICGGIQLYSDLCKLREDKVASSNQTRYWGEDLIPSFALAAWIVACHNIWFVEEHEEQSNCYKCLGLKALVYQMKTREIQKSSFLFLLCLVDSIEPVKFFNSVDVLKRIKVEFMEFGKISIINHGMCKMKFDGYVNKLKDLDNWLTDIKTADGIITIDI